MANYSFNNAIGNYPWIIWTDNPHEGNYCMSSSNNGVGSSQSIIEITVNYVVAGTISFYSRVSSEGGWDYGSFYIDGSQMVNEGGPSPNAWAIHSFNVSAGSHTFRWVYQKDSSINGGEDRYFIDDIEFNGVFADKPAGSKIGQR